MAWVDGWEKHDQDYETFGARTYEPPLPDGASGDGNHATGHLEGPEEATCDICQETGMCVYFSDHRFVDTDEIDLTICPKCLKMGLRVSEEPKKDAFADSEG
jgi:hypothetical protein